MSHGDISDREQLTRSGSLTVWQKLGGMTLQTQERLLNKMEK